nr:MAG TPA: hypothetical protein [Caudoviricetes sp.]
MQSLIFLLEFHFGNVGLTQIPFKKRMKIIINGQRIH